MKSIKIQGQLRDSQGTKGAKALRSEGLIPCIIYGGKDVVHFSAPLNQLNELLNSPSFVTAAISVDGKEYSAIVKETQFHPLSDKLLHMDFQELNADKAVVTEIPVLIEGRAKGVTAGGKLLTKVRKLKVKATPENLTEYIVVDVTNLGLNKSLKVKDLKNRVSGIEILHPDTIPIASVIIPRTLKTAAEEAAEEAAAEEALEGAASAEGGEETSGES